MTSHNYFSKIFAILDSTPIGHFVIDEECNVLFWNKCMEKWPGVKKDAIVGTSIYDHYPQLKEDKYCGRVKEVFHGGPAAVFSSQLHKYIIPCPLPGGKIRIQHTVVTGIQGEESGQYLALFSIQDETNLTLVIENYVQTLEKVTSEVEERKRAEEEKEKLICKLQKALDEIKTLQGIIPICSKCKKIRDDKGFWQQVEHYIAKHSKAIFSHGLCKSCADELYGGLDWYEKNKE